MRNMSFALTTQQVLDRTKRVTRRLGWGNLKVGERVCAVEKGMGLKKGEKINRLCVIECKTNWPEVLHTINKDDVILEGFPDMTPEEFIAMFCCHMGGEPDQIVNRIAFTYVEE